MRLSIAEIFSEHMVLQRNKPIHIWGRSIENDRISISLNGQKAVAECVDGKWEAVLDPEPENDKTFLKIESELLEEEIIFNDVAIGEVWLAGGQSNMEFIMKYDIGFEEMLKTKDDSLLRFFAYPQVSFMGQLERDGMGKYGTWRRWDSIENRKEFSAVGLYLSRILREKLNVPVGVISCNWGGTPASAWTKLEDVEGNPKLKRIIDWKNDCMSKLDMKRYFEASERPIPKPSRQQEEFTDYFMMGGDMSKFFSEPLPPMNEDIFSPYAPGPRSCIFAGNLYSSMLSRIAPYAIKGFLFYQGEDDDARDWQDFYDESMKTMIRSWRELWNEDLPFFQVELPPFRGYKMNGAKKYDLMRNQQHKAAKEMDDVYDVCILDAGDEFNIHPRNKSIVGNRLAYIVLKHAYDNQSRIADCPELKDIERKEDVIIITFENMDEISIRNDLKKVLKINGESDYEYETDKDRLVIRTKIIGKLLIEYCEENYCVPSIFNGESNPCFNFRKEME